MAFGNLSLSFMETWCLESILAHEGSRWISLQVCPAHMCV